MLWHIFHTIVLPLLCCPGVLGLLFNSCCCNQCQFYANDFSVDNFSTDFTAVSGSETISGGTLNTSSANAVFIGTTANPNSDSNTKVSVTVNIATSGDTARIILAYLDSNNYWFAEAKAGTGAYLKIFQRSGGTNTEMAGGSISLSTGLFPMCASISNGNLISVWINDINAAFSATFSDTGWGLGTGTRTGTVKFDDLTVSVTASGCPPCGTCTYCTDDSFSGEYKAVLSGIANGTCTNCASYNGTFYLPLKLLLTAPSCAAFEYILGSTPCTVVGSPVDSIQFEIVGFFANFQVSAASEYGIPGGAIVGYFSGPHSTEVCLAMSNVSFTPHSTSFCDFSAATCLVTTV